MPDELRHLLERFLADIAHESEAISLGYKNIDAWQQAMAQDLLVYHQAAYMTARDTRSLSPKEQASINEQVGAQLDYLNRFANELDQRGWQDSDAARAALYAGSIKPTYYRGVTHGYDLPVYPTEGSPCMVNCSCMWEMNEIDPEELSADFYWRLGSTEHCATCVDRARQWSPLRFRGGEQI